MHKQHPKQMSLTLCSFSTLMWKNKLKKENISRWTCLTLCRYSFDGFFMQFIIVCTFHNLPLKFSLIILFFHFIRIISKKIVEKRQQHQHQHQRTNQRTNSMCKTLSIQFKIIFHKLITLRILFEFSDKEGIMFLKALP